MSSDDMTAVAYRILRYLDACQRGGVVPTEGQALRMADVCEAYFASVKASLVAKGYVSGIEVRSYIDGTRGVWFSDPMLTLDGAEYMSESGAMAKARDLMGAAFEAAVSTAVAQLVAAAKLL